MQRRAFLLQASAGVAAAMLPRGARADQGSKVLVIGGSAMVGAVGRFIEEGLAEVGLHAHRRAKSSTGLARPDFFDWPAEARKLYEAEQPAATVCMFGGNDGQGLHMGKGNDPQWIRWHNDGWSEEYGRRVTEFADAVAPSGEHVFWVGMPAMRSNKLDGRMRRMNEIFSLQMDARPGGHFIDTRAALADRHGKYTEKILIDGRWLTVRSPDGVHYTRSGAKVIAEHVVPHLRDVLAGT